MATENAFANATLLQWGEDFDLRTHLSIPQGIGIAQEK